MKRFILFCWCCCSWLFMYASSTLTLSAFDGVPGDTITLTANLTTSDAIVATEVVIPLGEYISYVSSSAVLASARSNGHVLTASQVGEELRVYVYSMALQSLQGAEGVLFTCDLALGNKPLTHVLEPQVVMSDEAGAAFSCTTESTSVSILAPEMQVQTKTIDYGHIPIRSSYTQSLSIENTGTQPLTISSIAFTDAEFSSTTLPVIIPEGTTQSIDINYAPTRHGAVTALLTIYSDAVNGMYNAVRDVVLVADPFSVNELHVGNNSGIADDTVTISLTMNNMEQITAGQACFVLPSALRAVANSFTLSERAVDHQTLTQIIEDTLTIYFYSPTNTPLDGKDGELGTFSLHLDGTSGYYDLNPTGVVLSTSTGINMVSAFTSGYVSISSPRMRMPSSLTMDSISILDTATATLDISNTGDAPLVVERVTFLAEGYSCLTTLPITIEPWNSSSLQVQYSPSKEGSFGTTMQVYSNDPINRMQSVALSGTVYEPNSLSLSGILNGDTCVLSVSMNNYSEIAALQFDISGLAESDVVLTPSARLAQHTALLIPLTDGAYRVAVYNLSNASIADHDGEIMQLRFSIAGWSVVNSAINNIVLSNPIGQNKSTTQSASWTDVVTYTITWKNTDGSILDQNELVYGTMPAYNGATPTKQADAQYTYTFTGWSPEVVPVTGAATYTAIFNSTVNKYTITWKQDDGSLIDQALVEYGQVPTHADPTKQATAEYTYTFASWSPNVVAVVEDAEYIAVYTAIRNSYTITWKNDDGSIIDQTLVEYGQTPTHAEPTKAATAQYTYTFAGWSPNISAVTGEAIYTATFNATVRKYTITFLDDDGSLISQQSVEYGQIPQQEDPGKQSTARYTYIFTGWTPEIVAVTGNATYMATYSSILRKYTVTFLNDNGVILSEEQWSYGETPTCPAPTKQATAEYTYSFAGWSPEVVAVTGEAIYTATFDATKNKYLVVFEDEDGTELKSEYVEYGEMPIAPAAPSKEPTSEYIYTFAGWTPEIVVVTENATYTATYDATPVSEGIEDINAEDLAPQKVMIDGTIYILRGDKVYTLQGQEIK